MNDDPRCDGCKFWRPISDRGECYRFPPLDMDGNLPRTFPQAWCGEFQQKRDPNTLEAVRWTTAALP